MTEKPSCRRDFLKKSFAVASRNFRSLFNNNDPILRCIHSEPFPIEKLMPGESEDMESVILFAKGDYKVLLEQFENLKSRYW